MGGWEGRERERERERVFADAAVMFLERQSTERSVSGWCESRKSFEAVAKKK